MMSCCLHDMMFCLCYFLTHILTVYHYEPFSITLLSKTYLRIENPSWYWVHMGFKCRIFLGLRELNLNHWPTGNTWNLNQNRGATCWWIVIKIIATAIGFLKKLKLNGGIKLFSLYYVLAGFGLEYQITNDSLAWRVPLLLLKERSPKIARTVPMHRRLAFASRCVDCGGSWVKGYCLEFFTSDSPLDACICTLVVWLKGKNDEYTIWTQVSLEKLGFHLGNSLISLKAVNALWYNFRIHVYSMFA